MKKLIFIYCTMLATLSACQKDEPKDLDLNIVPDKTVINAGDSVLFHFDGNADVISFYSGEPGMEYQYRSRTQAEGLGIQLTIASRVLYGAQENNLKLLLSSKFSGIYTTDNVHDEDWIDITDKFTWSTAAAGGIAAGTTTSGPVDLSDYIVPGKPLYFGYRYESQAAATAGTAGRVWRLPTFKLETISPGGGISELANVLSAGWKAVPIISAVNNPEKTSYWTIRTADPYLWFTPNSTIEPHLHWMITAPFMPTAINPDKPIVIKGLIDKIAPYSYTFEEAGDYTVTFVVKNINSHGEKEMIKEFNIQVK